MSEIDPLLNRASIEDAFRRLGLADAEAVLAVCADVFPDEEVPGRARLILEDVFGG